jgi:cobalt-zinc-cadmium efflux system outer membrane protein
MKLFATFLERLSQMRRSFVDLACVSAVFVLGSYAYGQQTLSLHQAIEEGLRSPAAQVYQGQADQTSALIKQAKLRPNPRLFLQSEDLRPWNSNFSMADNSESYIFAGQTVEIAGKRGKRIDFAKANASRAEATAALLRQQLSARIANTYWTLAAAKAAVELQKQNLESADEVVRYHQERVSSGAMRGVDLLRMQLERDRAQLALQTAEGEANEFRLQLLRELGRNTLLGDVQLSDPLVAIDPVAEVSIDVALAQRADVRAANDSVTSARTDARLQRANGVPDPDFIGGYKRNVGENSLYTSLQIPLPFSNRNQGEIARADASVRTAEAARSQTELSARAEIEAARAAYERSRQMVQATLPEMQTRAKQNLAILDDAYRTGGTDLLRYIDARRLAVEVELSVLQRLAEYHASAVRLQLAYGEQL